MSKMATEIPESLISIMLSQMMADPSIPRQNPTGAFWQLPPHPTISDVQSCELPETTDYAIIGSGITGCSIAKNLLEHPSLSSSSRVMVFEARNLTSGATGRNGGALTSFAGYEFKTLCEHHSEEEATKIGRFTNRTLDKMYDLGNSSKEFKDASEVRRLRGVIGFRNEDALKHAQESFKLYEQAVPEGKADIEVLTPGEALSRYNLKDVAGALVHSCGAFWPYRLITRIWAQLLEQHSSRFSIETNTPVTDILYKAEPDGDFPYNLTTPRGIVRAKKVIHATNGYSGHLLPKLRGVIFPFRGTMSTQQAPQLFGRHGTEQAWSFSDPPNFDPKTGVLEAGLYYSNQNPKTGDIFIGGEKVPVEELIASDDSVVNDISRENISTVLPRFFAKGWADSERPEVRKVWSGIMGFTVDHLPLIGKLPDSVTGRKETGDEWIAAGFNGYGMAQCWSSGEAVAKMMLGEDVSEFLPASYLATEQRLLNKEKMSPEAALARLMGI